MGKKSKKGGKKKGAAKKKSSLNRDDELLQAVTNSKLLQNKLVLVEKQRDDYRATCKRLADENENVTNSLYQAERDTIEIIQVLKRQNIDQESTINDLTSQIESIQRQSESLADKLNAEFKESRENFKAEITKKTSEVSILQKELANVREFRKDKAQITSELRELYEQLEFHKNENNEIQNKMDQKFFIEKIKMEREANHKIGKYAEKAQKEAIAAMEETTKKVFRDNVHMSEAITLHMDRKDELEKENKKLLSQCTRLRQELEINQLTVTENVRQTNKAKDKILALKDKVSMLEVALEDNRKKSKEETALMLSTNRQSHNSDYIRHLESNAKLRDREMKKLKLLTRKIVDERSQMQKFFLDALNQVENEIKNARQDFSKKSKVHYNKAMAAAAAGNGPLPQVQTFSKSKHSTNDLDNELGLAQDWSNVEKGSDISDLTWEQKEKVIRLLFVKMNGLEKEKIKRLPPISRNSEVRLNSSRSALSELDSLHKEAIDQDYSGSTFITQTA